jgi:hypothetical protein
MHHTGPLQSVQPDIAEMAFVDAHADSGMAMPVGWQGIELAGTAIGAIAGRDFGSAYHPIGHRVVSGTGFFS